MCLYLLSWVQYCDVLLCVFTFCPEFSVVMSYYVSLPSVLSSVLWCPIMCLYLLSWVQCCDVRYDFCIKMMFGSSLTLPPVVCRRAHVLFTLFVLAWFIIMVFNATFNNISAISWQSVLLVEETGCTWRKPTCRKSQTSFITWLLMLNQWLLGVQHILCCVFVLLRLVYLYYLMLPVSLDRDYSAISATLGVARMAE